MTGRRSGCLGVTKTTSEFVIQDWIFDIHDESRILNPEQRHFRTGTESPIMKLFLDSPSQRRIWGFDIARILVAARLSTWDRQAPLHPPGGGTGGVEQRSRSDGWLLF